MSEAIEDRDGHVLLHVRVQPKASRESWRVDVAGRVRVALTAAPVDGAANAMLVALTAKIVGVPRRQVELVKGEKSREKVLRVDGVTAEAVQQAICAR